MIVTVFRSRLHPGAQEEYGPMAKRVSEMARTIPGYISHKGFVAEDGERVTIVEFETEAALHQWKIHPEHANAKRRGIESFFSDYKFQICSVVRSRAWAARVGDELISPHFAREGAPSRQVITPELIDYHRRLAHDLRNAAIRRAMAYVARAFLRLFRLSRDSST